MSERTLPHNLDAERSVLGAVLLDSEVFKLVPDLPAEDFFRDAHARAWKACGRIVERGQVVDFVTLREELERAGDLEAVGASYLAGLVDGVPKSSNVEYYAQIVRDKATLRRLIFQANETIAAAYDEADEVGAIVDAAEARLMAVGRQAAKGDFVVSSDWMTEMMPLLERAVTDKRVVTGVPSGIGRLDRMLRGFQPGDLILLAARPSQGKTALALQITAEASKHVMTGFVSLEMSRAAIGWRLLALESRIDAFRLMTGQISEREMRLAAEVLARLSERAIAIDDVSGQTASAVCAKLRRLAARYGIGFAPIDYVQLMTSGERTENRTQDIGAISRRLKTLARDLNIPVLALSQLTRDNEREKRPPRLSDLREGGDLEQAADVVIFIWRPHAVSGKFQPGEEVKIIVAKQRNGPTGEFSMAWDGPTMRLTEIVDEPEPSGPVHGAFAS